MISFEGIDASGKNTQTKMLCDYFRQKGVRFESVSFPDYSTPIGHEIRNYLSRQHEYSPETAHMLYAANRYELKPTIDRWISEEGFVVLNRYCESNIAYGVADGLPRLWLEQIESLMPQADYVFYLRITPNQSMIRKASRDRFEADLKLLARVSSVYDALASSPKWITLDAEREPGIIHYEIIKTLSALLNDRDGPFVNIDSGKMRAKAGPPV